MNSEQDQKAFAAMLPTSATTMYERPVKNIQLQPRRSRRISRSLSSINISRISNSNDDIQHEVSTAIDNSLSRDRTTAAVVAVGGSGDETKAVMNTDTYTLSRAKEVWAPSPGDWVIGVGSFGRVYRTKSRKNGKANCTRP